MDAHGLFRGRTPEPTRLKRAATAVFKAELNLWRVHGLWLNEKEPQALPMQPEQRRDPIELLSQQEAQRLPWLVPVRHSRMAQSVKRH